MYFVERECFQEAKNDLEQAVRIRTGDAGVVRPFRAIDYSALGLVLLREKKPTESLAAFDSALSDDQTNVDALRGRAISLVDISGKLGDEASRETSRKQAFQALTLALDRGGPNADLLVARAETAISLEQAGSQEYVSALRDYGDAIEIRPSSGLHAKRGWTKIVLKDPKAALSDFESAIRMDAENGDAYAGRALSLAWLNDKTRRSQVLSDADAALRNAPKEKAAGLHLNVARAYAVLARSTPHDSIRFQRRACELLQDALNLRGGSLSDRSKFWKAHVEKDEFFNPLHTHTDYLRLKQRYGTKRRQVGVPQEPPNAHERTHSP
jgi:tetratricopeptide (TPR) repeat protein